MKIKARIKKILEVETGTSKSGTTWRKQNFIVNQFTPFKDELCCSIFNDNISLMANRKEGETVELELTIKSREWNGKYYTNVNCDMISPVSSESLIQDEIEENPFE